MTIDVGQEMSEGFVYVLKNWAMPGLLKIGKTRRDSRVRARELSRPTGVPGKFEVAYEIFSRDYGLLEKLAHDALSEFRREGEFFRVSEDIAIAEIEKIVTPAEAYSDHFVAVRILESLKRKFSDFLRDEISDVRIVQCEERVWLEVTEEATNAGYLVDQKIHRSDLAFISSGDSFDELYFKPTSSVSSNARKFIEDFGALSIVHTTSLFKEEACKSVSTDPKYNPHLEKAD